MGSDLTITQSRVPCKRGDKLSIRKPSKLGGGGDRPGALLSLPGTNRSSPQIEGNT